MVHGTDLEAAAADADSLPNAEDVFDVDEDVPVSEVFDDAFVAEYTDFDSFDELVAASPSDADTGADLEYVGQGEWDEFVAENTDFENESELVLAARDYWVGTRLDLH